MKSHARNCFAGLCVVGGARNRALIAARLSGSRRRRRRRRQENSIIGGCGFCMRAGRGSRNHGESQRRGPQRHKRKSSCLPRGFILACWGRGGCMGLPKDRVSSYFRLFGSERCFLTSSVASTFLRLLLLSWLPKQTIKISYYILVLMWYPPDYKGLSALGF